MKEHRDACCRGMLDKSAMAEHAWKRYHPIKWEDTRVIDRARRPKELQLKEALTSRQQRRSSSTRTLA